MKICSQCNQAKPLAEFFRCSRRKDGHQSDCKICHYEQCKAFFQTNKGRIAQKRYNQTEKSKTARKRYHIQHPEYYKAYSVIRYAIKIGKLPHPTMLQCLYGNHLAQEYHHYLGYKPEHWLDVIPVCIKCHIKLRHKNTAS